jgi:hypothetical protein
MLVRQDRGQRTHRVAFLVQGAHARPQRQKLLGRHARAGMLGVEQLAVAVGAGLADGVEIGLDIGPSDVALGNHGDQSVLRVDGPVKRHGGRDLVSPALRAPAMTSTQPAPIRPRAPPFR